ncbi:uncharacterized protein LOC144581010 [Callithrix jacchus]
MQRGKCQLESSEEIRQKVDLLALAVQWKVAPRAPLPSASKSDDLGTACLAHVHTGSLERSKKLPWPQFPREERVVPSGDEEKSAFSLRARPKAERRGSPLARRLERIPGGAPAAAPREPAGEIPRRPTARRPGSSRCRACPSFGRLSLPPARATSARIAAFGGGRGGGSLTL